MVVERRSPLLQSSDATTGTATVNMAGTLSTLSFTPLFHLCTTASPQERCSVERQLQSLRAYSRGLKAKRNLENSTNIRKHETVFINNSWLYAKKYCSGKNTYAETDFSAETAYAYFLDSTASSHQTYQTLPKWVMPFSERDQPIEFDLSAITPGIIRKVPKSRPYNSFPGFYHNKLSSPLG